MRDLRFALLVIAAIVAANLVGFGQGGRVTVYQGARLITGTGGAAIENATFIVDGARFTQVGRVRCGESAARRDARRSGGQDGDSGDHRLPRAPQRHARGARRRSAAARLLRRRLPR